ncbi:MAG TPA: hypothetical protein VF378_02965 [Geothrix sp.]
MTMKIAAIALAGLALAGCATVHQLVDTPPLKGPVATLAYDHKLIVYILKIDGKRVFDDQVSHFDFPPGIHTFSLRFHPAPKQQTIHNGSEFDLSFDAKPNHKYRIEFSINQDYSKWSAHILDLETNSRVSSVITDDD